MSITPCLTGGLLPADATGEVLPDEPPAAAADDDDSDDVDDEPGSDDPDRLRGRGMDTPTRTTCGQCSNAFSKNGLVTPRSAAGGSLCLSVKLRHSSQWMVK